MAVYNSSVGWGQTLPCKDATGSRYQSIFWSPPGTHPPNIDMHECERRVKSEIEIDHRTRDYVPYSFRTVCRFFNVPQIIRNKCCETGPKIYRPYPRRLESLTATSCRVVRWSPNWANRLAVIIHTVESAREAWNVHLETTPFSWR